MDKGLRHEAKGIRITQRQGFWFGAGVGRGKYLAFLVGSGPLRGRASDTTEILDIGSHLDSRLEEFRTLSG